MRWSAPLRTRNEKTYSEPFATRLYAKETIDVPGKGTVRDYPRLKYGGIHLGEREDEVAADAGLTAFRAGMLPCWLFWRWLAVAGGVARNRCGRRERLAKNLARRDGFRLECVADHPRL
jgi:peptide/nickel transport system permease protein